MGDLSDNCIRFAPFMIDRSQLDSIHGVDENMCVSSLSPAVDFYRFVIKNA